MQHILKAKILLKLITLTLLIWFILHVSILLYVGVFSEVKRADAILILGNTVEASGLPSERLRGRLDKGLSLYMSNISKTIIVSGGDGLEGYNEAEVMSSYLINKGVPANDIIIDKSGNTTYQTAQNLKQIIRERDIKSIVIVSQYFHLLRAKMAVDKIGINEVYLSAGTSPFELRDFYSIPREVIAYYYYLIFK